MPTLVADLASNAEENILHAAKVLGRSKTRRQVFQKIYTGRKRTKTVRELVDQTGCKYQPVVDAGKALADNHIVKQVGGRGTTAYEKIDFFHRHKRRILSLAGSKERQNAFPTKRNPGGRVATSLRVQVSTRRARAKQVTLEGIQSFAKAWEVEVDEELPRTVSETQFRNGIQAILGQLGTFKDWGGESNDLYSTRLEVAGKRRPAAFAFKGPGTRGPLVPAKLGKNGDQIQRLVESPAEVFIIQYWSQIKQPVLTQLAQLAMLKSLMEQKQIWYGILDGQDSHRIYKAYRNKFGDRVSRRGKRGRRPSRPGRRRSMRPKP